MLEGTNKKVKQAYDYFMSEENIQKCLPFISECQRLSEIIKQFDFKTCQANYDELNKKVLKKEYSVGGETLYRGFYCPSPIDDIIIENSNRGKLLKHVTLKSKPNYRYMFDDSEKLILVDYIHLMYKEIIVWQNGVEMGVVFSNKGMIKMISESRYLDNKIFSYLYCLYGIDGKVIEYTKENYKYSEAGLSDVHIDRFLNSREALILRQEKYRFKHDTDGYLSQYAMVETFDGMMKKIIGTDEWIDIKIKRKI